MERKNASKSIYLCYKTNNYNQVKQVWEPCEVDDHHDHDHGDDDHDEFCYVDHEGMMMMMAWPPRSYTCSFCKREFRSAQALGGHMNVHRRDRAQLRQLSHEISPNNSPDNTPLNLNLPPNPNTINLSPPPPQPPPPPPQPQPAIAPPPLLLVKSPPPPYDVINRKQFECFRRKHNLVEAPNSDQAFKGFLGLKRQEDCSLKKASGIIRLDLEMNINVNDAVMKEDLDLELRLGYN